MTKDINIYLQNVRGLRTKTQEIFTSVVDSEYDLIGLVETWLHDGIQDGELFDDNYQVFREDRDPKKTNKGRGGGLLLAVKNNFICEKINLVCTDKSVELLCIKISLRPKPLYVYVIYIPPSLNSSTYESLFNLLETSIFSSNSNFVIMGDLNLNENNPNIMRSFDIFCNLIGGTQGNTITNINNRMLDVVISDLNFNVERAEPFVTEDNHHPSLKFSIIANYTLPTCTNSNALVYNFKKADFLRLFELLRAENWEVLNKCEDVNKAMEVFYDILYEIFDKCVPKTKLKINKFPSWFTPEIVRDIKAKERNHKLYKKTKLEQCLVDYKFLRAKIKKDIKIAYNNYLGNVEANIQQDVKAFWNFVHSKKNNKKGIPSEMIYNGYRVEGGQDIAQSFADHFQSVYQVPGKNHQNNLNSNFACGENFTLNEVTDNDVSKAIDKLKNKKTMGPDFVPSYVIKGCKDVLVKPFVILLNMSLKQRVFPDKLKIARIIPVYKSGEKNIVSNYRPIAILSNIAKVFEIIICSYLNRQIDNKISDFQHGFRKKRSSCGNLVDFVNYATNALAKNNQVDVIYTDFAKAFDKVDHSIILEKLHHFGLSEDLIKFISSYLTERKQYVVVNNFKSDYYVATSGIPQGSNLGPLLFLAFINDIVNCVHYNQILLFADDIKIFNEINCYQDCAQLQTDINNLYTWSVINRLPFNINKCKKITFSHCKQVINFQYNMNNVNLEPVTTVEDLGILFDTKLSFNDQLTHTVKQSHKTLGFILRNSRHFKCKKTLVMLFTSFVRSKFDYCSVVWCPYYVKFIHMVERVQMKFIKFANFILVNQFTSNSNYLQNLTSFNLMSLYNRRVFFSVLYLYKIINNLSCDKYTLSKLLICVPNIKTRHNSNTFTFPTPTKNYVMRSPIYTMIKNYNSLHNSCDIFGDTLSIFITKLKYSLNNIAVR